MCHLHVRYPGSSLCNTGLTVLAGGFRGRTHKYLLGLPKCKWQIVDLQSVPPQTVHLKPPGLLNASWHFVQNYQINKVRTPTVAWTRPDRGHQCHNGEQCRRALHAEQIEQNGHQNTKHPPKMQTANRGFAFSPAETAHCNPKTQTSQCIMTHLTQNCSSIAGEYGP